jgi:hypothetical protein
MYAAGEYIPGDAQFEYESDVSIDETSSMDTNEHDIKKHNELYKRIDPDYYSFKVLKHNEDGELYHHKINIFSSPSSGFIRNASSGVCESYRVGSKYEDLFFSVKDTGLYTGNIPRKLFYRNPEEYERHQFQVLSKEVKTAWHEKFLKMNSRLQY